MPKFSDAEKEFIRQKLMQEGERLFVSFGIKKVSIDEIVQATGIAKGSFYSFYQSKEHLYMDIAGNLQMRMWQEMDEFLNENRSLPPRELCKQCFLWMFDELQRYPMLKQANGETADYLYRKLIHQGEKVALLGNNGAGKSTFFLCANGILKPQKGKVYLEGKEIHWDKQEITELRQKIGLVFQEADSQLIAGTVESEVSFGPMNLKISEDDVRERVEDALGNMGLKTLRKRAPHYLSGGEKKRVSIADVLAMRPRMLLMDEPASSLDPFN